MQHPPASPDAGGSPVAPHAPLHGVRFGEFELDLRSGDLHAGTRRVILAEQPLLLLKALLERPGELVTREELRHRLWPADTFVDFEHGLNAVVKRLREALNDSADAPRFIETVPRRGYRFLGGSIAQPAVPGSESPGVGQTVGPQRAARPLSWRRIATAAAVVVAFAVGWFVWLSRRSETPPMRIVPLTAFRGSEIHPTFSPDDGQVAFSWNGETEDNYDIYLKLVGTTDVRRLTSDGAIDFRPAWSPDGRLIAFLRTRENTLTSMFVHVVSPLGGEERRLVDFPVGPVSWSPDSRWLIAGRYSHVPEEHGVFRIPAGTGAPRQVTRAPAAPGYHMMPALSPDGRRLAYANCQGSSCAIELLDMTEEITPVGEPRQLARHPTFISGIAWSRDGRSVIYWAETVPWGFYLWRVRAGGGEAERIEIAGLGAAGPAVARTQDRMAFSRLRGTVSVRRLSEPDPSRPVLASTLWDFHPQFSPDGRSIAFASSRNAETVEIWVSSPDGRNARQFTRGPGGFQSSPSWSPDGRHLAFDSESDAGTWHVWVAALDGGLPRRLTDGTGSENVPTWSRDGRWAYFSADHGGGRDIWRVSAGGGRPERITRGGSSFVAHESADGRDLIYKQDARESPLLAQPLDGGARRTLLACVHGEEFAVGPAGIYYAACGEGPKRAVHVFDPRTGSDRVLGSIKDTLFFDFERIAVSPDGGTVLYHEDAMSSDLMIIENFR